MIHYIRARPHLGRTRGKVHLAEHRALSRKCVARCGANVASDFNGECGYQRPFPGWSGFIDCKACAAILARYPILAVEGSTREVH